MKRNTRKQEIIQDIVDLLGGLQNMLQGFLLLLKLFMNQSATPTISNSDIKFLHKNLEKENWRRNHP